VLLGQPAIWTVPLAFGVMIVVSLLTRRTVSGNVGQVMLLMHLPEALSRQAYRTVSQASLLAQDRRTPGL